MRMERAGRGLALLLHHDRRDPSAHIGIIEDLKRERDGDLTYTRGMMRFSKRPAAQEVRADVLDGIRKDVSAGYRVWEVTQEKASKEEPDVYRVTDWEPLEGSLVPVPADIAVGVQRDASSPAELYRSAGATVRRPEAEKTADEPEEVRSEPEAAAEAAPAESEDERAGTEVRVRERAASTASEREDKMERETQDGGAATATDTRQAANPADVLQLAEDHAVPMRTAREWIERELPMDEVRGNILSLLAGERGAAAGAPPAEAFDLPDEDLGRYSLARAIASRLDQDVDAGFEREVSDHISKRLGKAPEGMFVPTQALGLRSLSASEYFRHARGSRRDYIEDQRSLADLRRQVMKRAALDSTTAGAAEELVFTEAGGFIELLRNRTMVMALGATVLPGLRAPISFPRQTAASTASWVGENPGADVAESELGTDLVDLAPKTLQATTATTRQLVRQAITNPVLEDLIRRDLMQVHAIAIDAASIEGGGANEPTGALADAGVNVVPIGATGGAFTWAHALQLEQKIAESNAEGIGGQAILTTPGVRAKLKQTLKVDAVATGFIWEDDEVNGYASFVSNNVPSDLTKSTGSNLHALIQAVWDQLMIGEWGVLDIIVDPYAQKKRGIIELTSFQMVDVAIRHPGAFAVCKDIDPTA